MIELINVSKKYGSKEILNGISILFEKGKIYGIMGENGAGKTTLFNCIAGLEKFDGEINSGLKVLKNELGLLTTEPFFFSKMTGKEYLQLLCNARSIQVTNFEEKNIFDLPLNQYATTYSTGMKKKLALTAMLLQENACFILDEPFNGVDIHSNILITEIIHKLKSLQKTVLISSHIFSTLSETCDEILLLENGKFSKRIFKENFSSFETEMKNFSIGNKIDCLELK